MSRYPEHTLQNEPAFCFMNIGYYDTFMEAIYLTCFLRDVSGIGSCFDDQRLDPIISLCYECHS